MDYKQALREQMEQYYQITARYRSATVDAMKDARRPGLLKSGITADISPVLHS